MSLACFSIPSIVSCWTYFWYTNYYFGDPWGPADPVEYSRVVFTWLSLFNFLLLISSAVIRLLLCPPSIKCLRAHYIFRILNSGKKCTFLSVMFCNYKFGRSFLLPPLYFYKLAQISTLGSGHQATNVEWGGRSWPPLHTQKCLRHSPPALLAATRRRHIHLLAGRWSAPPHPSTTRLATIE